MIFKSACSHRLFRLFGIILLAVAATAVRAQSSSIGGGTLSWTVTESSSGKCGPQTPPEYSYTEWSYGSFSFAYGGSTWTLGGDANYIQDNNTTTGCPPNGAEDASITLPGGPDAGCVLTFTPSSGGGGSVGFSSPCDIGIVDPAYQVVSILYAPPGNSSTVSYIQGTTNGLTSTMGNSFTDSQSMTLTEGFAGIFSVSTTTGSSDTTSNGSAYQETFTDATGIGIDSDKTNPDEINHTLDGIVIWLNPQISVVTNGSYPVSYSLGLQPISGGATPTPDLITVPAIDMQANSSNMTTVPPSFLNPQSNSTPGLASICKGLNVSEYDASGCTLAGQCGCVPSDFTNILTQDPLLGYSNTESPLSADVSGATTCASPTSSSSCRYVPVPAGEGSSTPMSVKLEGAGCASCDELPNTYTQTDETTETQTLGGQQTQSVGASIKVGASGLSLTETSTTTYLESESTGTLNGKSNSMSVTLNTSTWECSELVNVYEDTVFHTFVFQEPTSTTTGCTR